MGISALVSGEEVSFKGILSVVPGDNFVSQYLGGYKSLASAHCKCRNCFAVKEDMQTKVRNNYIVIKNIHTNFFFFLMNSSSTIMNLMHNMLLIVVYY